MDTAAEVPHLQGADRPQGRGLLDQTHNHTCASPEEEAE